MNNVTRKRISEIVVELSKAASLVEPLASEIVDMQSDEQEKFENMTEGLQASERGQRIRECAEQLQEAADKIQEAFDSLEEAQGTLDSAGE